MDETRRRQVTWTLFVAAGVAVLVVGSVVAVGSYQRLGTCGDYDLAVERVPAADVGDPDDYRPFADLDDRQQAAFERARATEGTVLVDGSTETFVRVAHEGDYYRATPNLRVCDVSPGQTLWLGVALAAVGLVTLGSVGRSVRRARLSGE